MSCARSYIDRITTRIKGKIFLLTWGLNSHSRHPRKCAQVCTSALMVCAVGEKVSHEIVMAMPYCIMKWCPRFWMICLSAGMNLAWQPRGHRGEGSSLTS